MAQQILYLKLSTYKTAVPNAIVKPEKDRELSRATMSQDDHIPYTRSELPRAQIRIPVKTKKWIVLYFRKKCEASGRIWVLNNEFELSS